MTEDFKHIPVLPLEAVSALAIRPGGIYVDGTLGGGGHSALILSALGKNGRLIGIDRDTNAIAAANKRLNISQLYERNVTFETVHGNFHDLPQILHDKNIVKVDGVLLDLGVSSHQLDTPERGFSYRLPGRLDMRMNQDATLTAFDIVNTYPEEQLANILYTFGEERFSRRVAKAIVAARLQSPIETTLELSSIIEKAMPHRSKKANAPHPAMRSFMALRIAVNDELHPLDTALTNIVNCLNPGGRICVISFHSLEDRIVKTCFNRLASPCTCPRDIPYCVCGKPPLVQVITRKPILPSPEELAQNSRASSAKLRVGEKIII
ncbi:MAG: 16S rRNA (cytosine(1402)-N(4))-methyltransferase RsmH [Defluviitaleaceae bacterium]|nr:16S rRNA (cytosine(1402)-N(4))-methyltransferase RsmH [Defluviitaleaceae bacterium]